MARRADVYDWATHAPDLAEPAPVVKSGTVALRGETLPAPQVEPGMELAYDERTGEPYYRRPQPVVVQQDQQRDPWPARLACGGIGLGAAGFGLGYLFQAIAQAAVGIGLLAACLGFAWLLKSGIGGGSRGGKSVNVRGNGNKVTML